MAEDAPPPADHTKDDALARVGVFWNDQGFYEYGSHEDVKTKDFVAGVPLSHADVEAFSTRSEALKKLLTPLLPTLGVHSVGDAFDKLLADKGYLANEDMNFVKDGTLAPPSVLLSTLESTVQSILQATTMLKQCGTSGCDAAGLRTHLDATRAWAQETPAVANENLPDASALPTAFDLAQMQKTLQTIEFFKSPSNMEALAQLMQHPEAMEGSIQAAELLQRITVSDVGKSLVANVGNGFVQDYLVHLISDAYRDAHLQRGEDASAPAQLFLQQLENAQLQWNTTWQGKGGEQVKMLCGASYDVMGEMTPASTPNGATVGCGVSGRF